MTEKPILFSGPMVRAITKAISLQPPWGWLTVHGLKDMENREWRSSFVGRIIIHQSRSWDFGSVNAIARIDRVALRKLMDAGDAIHWYGLIGEVDFGEQVDRSGSKWFFGRFAWPCSNAVAYPNPIRYRGQLGIFEVRP